ncbi:MAG: TfoX/Sxy family protein [Amaricoccus sp.]
MAKPRPELVDWLEDVFAPLGPISVGRLFGGWQFKAAGLAFATVIGEVLYFRAGPDLRAALEAEGSVPFRYAKAAGRTVTVARLMSAPEAAMDDEAALLDWATRALAGADALG